MYICTNVYIVWYGLHVLRMNELDPPLIDKAYAKHYLRYSVMRKLKSQECDLGSNTGPDIYSGTLTSEPPDSLMVEECRIVLIPKLASNSAVSDEKSA